MKKFLLVLLISLMAANVYAAGRTTLQNGDSREITSTESGTQIMLDVNAVLSGSGNEVVITDGTNDLAVGSDLSEGTTFMPIGGVYNETANTYPDGANVLLQTDNRGDLKVVQSDGTDELGISNDLSVTKTFIPVGGVYNATNNEYTSGQDVMAHTDKWGNVRVASMMVPYTEFTSPKDFSATYTSTTTITLAGLPISVSDSSQVMCITVNPSAVGSALYIDGVNGVSITISSSVVTITNAGTPFASGDAYRVGIDAQTKAHDASTNSTLVSVINPDYSRYTASVSLVTSENLSHSGFFDVGAEISMEGYTKLNLYVSREMYACTNLQFQILAKTASGGASEYFFPIETVAASKVSIEDEVLEFTDDLSNSTLIKVEADGVPFIQLQGKTDDPSGGTATNVTIDINKVWR